MGLWFVLVVGLCLGGVCGFGGLVVDRVVLCGFTVGFFDCCFMLIVLLLSCLHGFLVVLLWCLLWICGLDVLLLMFDAVTWFGCGLLWWVFGVAVVLI